MFFGRMKVGRIGIVGPANRGFAIIGWPDALANAVGPARRADQFFTVAPDSEEKDE